MKNRAQASAAAASLSPEQDGAEFQFERPEWTLFRSVNTLPQKAGVPLSRLRRLVLKELTDNALDAGGRVWLGRLDDNGDRFFVEDDGPGIDPDQVARLFSINRPLVSSKLRRCRCAAPWTMALRMVISAVKP